MTATAYTLEIFKTDRRTKAGERLIEKVDYEDFTREEIEVLATEITSMGYRVAIFETYVARTNMMSGSEFKERYDTPYYCSPSSETYWSM